MSGISHTSINVSQEHIRFVMPNIAIVTCKFGQKSKSSRKWSQSENGQTTY
jgi:hypothetical protein